MRHEAELHAEEDKQRKEAVEVRNQAEGLAFQLEKLIKESGDKMKPEDKSELETKISELKTLKDSGDVEELKKKLEEVSAVAQRVGSAMYAANASAPEAAQDSSSTGEGEAGAGDQGTVEGEVEK